MRTLCLLVLVAGAPAWALNDGLGAPPAALERSTPRRTVTGFAAAAHAGDYALAAHYLDLDHLPRAQQREQGMRLARRFKFVMDHRLWPDTAGLSDEPGGEPRDARHDELGTMPLGGAPQVLRVSREAVPGGEPVWVFSADTVKAIDRLYSEYGPPFGESLPAVLLRRPLLGLEPWQWLGLVAVLLGALGLGFLLERLTVRLAARLARWTRFTWDDALVASAHGPLLLSFFAVLAALGTRGLLLPPGAQYWLDVLCRSLVIVSGAWFILRFLRVSAQYVQQQVTTSAGAARARGLQTQLTVMRHVFEVATWVVATALLLMQFEVVRTVGVSLLASAGIAGLVLGLAAQKSIGSLLAGIQLSVTQPIRIGDRVVVEGEFGTVEEITLTYVVVAVWDQRRLIVPITQFLDKAFQNWSRAPAELLGTVMLQLDYLADMSALRAELTRVLTGEARELWDGKTATVQVTEVLDKTLQVRVLVSAEPDKLWDLRCLVRERLVTFLGRHQLWLPITRTEPRPLPDDAEDPEQEGPRA